MVALIFVVTRAADLATLMAGSRKSVVDALVLAAGAYDGTWYQLVVIDGYRQALVPGHPIARFYPGFPLLVQLVYQPVMLLAAPFHVSPHHGFGLAMLTTSTLLVTNGALLVAAAVLWRLYRERLGATATLIGIGLLLCQPSSMVFSLGYSEAPFLAFTALALVLAERGRWVAAGAAAGGACLVRFPGFLIVLPLAVIWLGSAKPRTLGSAVAGLALFGAGVLGYPVYLAASFHDRCCTSRSTTRASTTA